MRSLYRIHLAIFLSLSLTSCAMADPSRTDGALSPASIKIANRPAPPAVFLDTKLINPTGRKIRVSSDLQKAIDEAAAGDVIVIEAGKTYTGNFTLPRKAGKSWITIRSSEVSQLPPEGKRVSPADAKLMPKIITPNTRPAIATEAGANHYRLIGIEVGLAENVTTISNLIALGDVAKVQTAIDQVPSDLIIDRCFIHGNPETTMRRGVAINSARTAIIDSYISDCHEFGADSQAICGWNGPGPFKIVNNYLEGAGENVMFGGGEPGINDLVPSDIEFRGNHCFKPLTWKVGDPSFTGKRWTVKNIFELKNARRVLIDGNMFENNWSDAQTGYAILFTVKSQGPKAPWTVVEDITFTNNVVRHTSAAINISGQDTNNKSEQGSRILISNNLFDYISPEGRGGDGVFVKISKALDVTIDHNTAINSGNIITAYAAPTESFTFTNNIVQHNKYGVKGNSVGVGLPTIERYFPGSVFRKNAIVGGQSRNYPDDNFFPSQISFSNSSSGNRQVDLGSEFSNAGTDGKSLGCDFNELKSAFKSVQKPQKSQQSQ